MGQGLVGIGISGLLIITDLMILFLFMFLYSERERTGRGGAKREERIPSRPDTELNLTSREIMT